MADLSKLPQASPQCYPPGVTDQQGKEAFEVRFGTATAEAIATAHLPQHPTNGDEQTYKDRSGTYTKCLKQAAPGIVDPAAFADFRKALGTPGHAGTADFEVAGLLGLGRPLNGPLGAFAKTLVGADSQNYGAPLVPPAPKVASQAYATELVELYWASLLRDVAFEDYPTHPTAIAAAAELSGLATYTGPRDPATGRVTPELLFRAGPSKVLGNFFAGETVGPYVSQLAILATTLGVQPIDQRLNILAPGIDYMTDLATWAAVQDGAPIPAVSPFERAYLFDGRGLSSYTHVDELYQAYLIAYLVLKTLGIPMNPGSPYSPGGFKQQVPFGTFGGPDIAATLGAVARTAINTVWWQKWIVHLRHRPESGGGLVHLRKTGAANLPQAAHDLDPIILDAQAVAQSHAKYGSYLLSQAFPEGSPAHPAYPTGHGTVGGACITVLKFFFDGNTPIAGPQVSPDGQRRINYTGPDAGKLTVDGELHKLAHNISFGHGIHAGIHWRSDTDSSLLLGEEVALRFLQDQAWTYRENFKIQLTKMDGSTATIKNF